MSRSGANKTDAVTRKHDGEDAPMASDHQLPHPPVNYDMASNHKLPHPLAEEVPMANRGKTPRVLRQD